MLCDYSLVISPMLPVLPTAYVVALPYLTSVGRRGRSWQVPLALDYESHLSYDILANSVERCRDTPWLVTFELEEQR